MTLTFHNIEFEQAVRQNLSIYDRAITSDDAILVYELDLSNFDFDDNDDETLFYFNNLKLLDINTGSRGQEFWKHFSKIETLYWSCWYFDVDFSVFAHMDKLKNLSVSGGDYSEASYLNLDALIPLKELHTLTLHEFGPVDISPLINMPQLSELTLVYSDQIKNIDLIGRMTWLKRLELGGLYTNNLDFLDTLPDNIELDICGIELYGCTEIDINKLRRFKNGVFDEISVKNQYWDYVDLSGLPRKYE